MESRQVSQSQSYDWVLTYISDKLLEKGDLIEVILFMRLGQQFKEAPQLYSYLQETQNLSTVKRLAQLEEFWKMYLKMSYPQEESKFNNSKQKVISKADYLQLQQFSAKVESRGKIIINIWTQEAQDFHTLNSRLSSDLMLERHLVSFENIPLHREEVWELFNHPESWLFKHYKQRSGRQQLKELWPALSESAQKNWVENVFSDPSGDIQLEQLIDLTWQQVKIHEQLVVNWFCENECIPVIWLYYFNEELYNLVRDALLGISKSSEVGDLKNQV